MSFFQRSLRTALFVVDPRNCYLLFSLFSAAMGVGLHCVTRNCFLLFLAAMGVGLRCVTREPRHWPVLVVSYRTTRTRESRSQPGDRGFSHVHAGTVDRDPQSQQPLTRLSPESLQSTTNNKYQMQHGVTNTIVDVWPLDPHSKEERSGRGGRNRTNQQ